MGSPLESPRELAPYRTSELDALPPRTWIELVWRWLLLRRMAPPAPQRFLTTHMRRNAVYEPFLPYRVEVGACPGRGRAPQGNHDYWLCTRRHCVCTPIVLPP